MGRELGEDIVKLVVGSDDEAKTFPVHRKRLCQKVPYFEAMFNGPYIEGQTQSAKMPEDDPIAFQSMLAWVYLDTIEHFTAKSTKGGPILDMTHYITLYALAEKYNITELADMTMDYMLRESVMPNCFPRPDQIKICYELTHAESKLRVFVSRCFAYLTLTLKDDHAKGLWNKDKLYDLMVEVPDLGKDALLLLRHQAGKTIPDPRIAPPCDYHQHAAEDPCPDMSTTSRKRAREEKCGLTR